jgi:hypothetical protein
LSDCRVAIAFDRRGTSDVITSQFGGRCCSDAVAVSIADQLTAAEPGLQYRPASGTYTDTAEYVDTIAECTNLSVGYEHEHTRNEMLSWRHIKRLARAVCSDAWRPEAIEPVRDPSARVTAWDDFAWRGWDDVYGAHNRPEADDRTYRRVWDRLSDIPDVEPSGTWYTGSCALCDTVSDRLNEDGACSDCSMLLARM